LANRQGGKDCGVWERGFSRNDHEYLNGLDQTGKEGVAFSYAVAANTFADVDAGDVLSFSAKLASGAALPSWLSFNAATQVFSGTPPTGSAGTLSIVLTATDKAGAAVSDTFNLGVSANVTTINGTSAADKLTGTAGNDKIYGLAGDDTLTGAAGND
jgi:Ca2+-binding RTX toxin-like protein